MSASQEKWKKLKAKIQTIEAKETEKERQEGYNTINHSIQNVVLSLIKEATKKPNVYKENYNYINELNLVIPRYNEKTNKYDLTSLTGLLNEKVPPLESSETEEVPVSSSAPEPTVSQTPTMAEVIQTNPETPVSEFKGTATSSVVAPAQIQTQAEKSQPIFTTSLDPLTEVKEASSEPPPLVSSREPSVEPEGEQLVRNTTEQALQHSSSSLWSLPSVLTTGWSMFNSQILRDRSTETYLRQDQSQAPHVSTSEQEQIQEILAKSPEYGEVYMPSTKSTVQPRQTEVHEETLVSPDAGVNLPETTPTVNVVATPSPSSSIMHTHQPNIEPQAEDTDIMDAYENMFEPKTKYIPEAKRSQNAPRADIEHKFGDYAIAPTRSPLISKDKAVGILPFPDAFKTWKYISQTRPYVLSSTLNKYQYYPSVNLATKRLVK